MCHALNGCYQPSKVKLRGDKVHDTFDFDDFMFSMAPKKFFVRIEYLFSFTKYFLNKHLE